MGLTHHLVRRGVAMARDQFNSMSSDEQPVIHPSKATMMVVGATVVFFCLWSFCVKYSYLFVVGTLAIIENPQNDVLVVNLGDDNDSNKKVVDSEVLVIKPQPVTARIRTAIQHLRARAGYWSRFRGMSLFIIYHLARNTVIHLFTFKAVAHHPVARMIAFFCADMILCRWEMIWVHIVISEPSALPWYKRGLRGWKPLKNIAPAAALKSAATQLSIILPMFYICHSKLAQFRHNPPTELTPADIRVITTNILVAFFMHISLVLLIQIPATVTFVRVAASMLPEEEETIVSFDRSFGGKVTPAIVGGAGKVGLLEAWRSFDRSSRLRLLKLIFKVVGIQIAISLLCMGVVIGELKVMMGDDFDKMIEQGKKAMKH